MVVSGRKLLMFGGNDHTVRMNGIHELDTEVCVRVRAASARPLTPRRQAMRWSVREAGGAVPLPRSAHSAAMVTRGRGTEEMVVFGGWDGQEELGDTHLYNVRRVPMHPRMSVPLYSHLALPRRVYACA